MADETTRWKLAYILANQAQKHITHNEAIRLLDALLHTSAISRAETDPPGSPTDADCYLVASGGTGAWEDWDGNIAYYVDGGWMKIIPQPGMRVWIEDEAILLAYDGSSWAAQGGGTPDPVRFAAFLNFDQSIAADTWAKVSINNAEWNDQGHFNTSTNRFTAPSAGMYFFGASVGWKQSGSVTPVITKVRFIKNGTTDLVAPLLSRGVGGLAVDGTEIVLMPQCIVMLASGDTVELQQLFTAQTGYAPASVTRFFGYKIA